MQRALILSFLLLQALLLGYLSWSTSPNRTESGHIGAMVYLGHTGHFDVFHVNPPLTRFIAGLPVKFFCSPNYDWKSYSPRPQDRSEWQLGSAFISANSAADVRFYVFLSRLALIPLILLGSYFGYRFASELYGQRSGVMFLILWTFSPLVLGWGATICPDAAAASLGIAGLYMFRLYLRNPSWRNTFLAGFGLGLLPLMKLTWIIAYPIWLLVWLVWQKQINIRTWNIPKMCILILVSLYVINTGYIFDGTFRLLKDYKFISGTLTGQDASKTKAIKPGNRFADSILGYIPVPLPGEFVQGIDTQRRDFERGIGSYMNGVWSEHGWKHYYAYVLLLKEPLGILLLSVITIGVTFFYRKNYPVREELILLLPTLLIFAFISSQDGFSLHPRYILLVLPFLYLWVSKTARYTTRKEPVLLVLTTGCVLWCVISSMSFYPYSMSYFNELAGKPTDYPKYLLGSNISWGQEAYDVKRWLDKHPDAKPLYLSVSSSIPLNKMGIGEEKAVPTDPAIGWMLIDVNSLYEKADNYAWLKKHQPVEMIGYSIWVYHIEKE
ncbi:hypothetical protein FACS189419_07160 [Planctomycetales bacterium]|nr:hypothetical protein FACS189419_07160 [Planctomycetales bacterium]